MPKNWGFLIFTEKNENYFFTFFSWNIVSILGSWNFWLFAILKLARFWTKMVKNMSFLASNGSTYVFIELLSPNYVLVFLILCLNLYHNTLEHSLCMPWESTFLPIFRLYRVPQTLHCGDLNFFWPFFAKNKTVRSLDWRIIAMRVLNLMTNFW